MTGANFPDMYAWHPPELAIARAASACAPAIVEDGASCNSPVHLTAEPIFRRWTVDGTPMSPDRELVPGLRRALQDAGLSCYSDAAEKWCIEMGAAFVTEILEEVE